MPEDLIKDCSTAVTKATGSTSVLASGYTCI